MFVLFVMRSYLIEVRGLKQGVSASRVTTAPFGSYLIEVRGLKQGVQAKLDIIAMSYLIEVRGLKHGV